MARRRRARRLLAGGLLLLLGVVAGALPLHAGTAACGSLVAPGPESSTKDCRDQQRVLLAVAPLLVLVGAATLAAGAHQWRPVEAEGTGGD